MRVVSDCSMKERDDKEASPLHYAAALAKPDTVSLLLDAGATVVVPDVNGRTPLHYAAELSFWMRVQMAM
jgi:ankyrin repeat protein